MQRGARSFFRRSAPMQRGTSFAFYHDPCGALCWAQRRREKRYKTNAFCLIFNMKGTLGAATKWIPKSNIHRICLENECFVQLPGELFSIHLS